MEPFQSLLVDLISHSLVMSDISQAEEITYKEECRLYHYGRMVRLSPQRPAGMVKLLMVPRIIRLVYSFAQDACISLTSRKFGRTV